MAVTLTTPNTILGVLEPKTTTERLLSRVAMTLVGSLLLIISAKISVPTWPVPVTLQTFAVAALSAAFGWRIGFASVVAYILEGLAGVPVFAGVAAGPAYLFGPTGGFIISWLLTAPLVGLAADRGLSRRVLPLFAVMLLGDAISFVFGFGWLVTVLANLKGVGVGAVLGSAFDGAIKPFIVWDVLKMAFAALTVTSVFTLVKKRG